MSEAQWEDASSGWEDATNWEEEGAKKGPSFFDKLNAGVEAAANTAAGLVTFPVAMGLSGLHNMNEISQGRQTNFEKDVATSHQRMMEPLISRTSSLGEDYTDNINEILNHDILPMAGVHIPSARGQAIKADMNRALKEPIAERTKPVEAKWEDTPAWRAKQGKLFREQEARENYFADENNVKQSELELISPEQARVRDMPVDENGMPVDMTRSLDAQEAGAPRQIDTFNENTRFQAEQQRAYDFQQQAAKETQMKTELEALPKDDYTTDIERAYADRQRQLFDEKQAEKQAKLNDEYIRLEQQLRSDAYTPDLQGQGPKTRAAKAIPRNQRGTLNMDIFDPIYEKVKSLTNGIILQFKGDENFPTIVASRNGQQVGKLQLNATDYISPSERSNLTAAWVDTTGASKEGLAKEMYKFAAEQGADIVPSKVQTSAGKAMWDRFSTEGLALKNNTQGFVIPRNQRGGIDYNAAKEIGKKIGQMINPKAIPKVDNVVIPKTKEEVMSSIPGIKQGIRDLIPENPSVPETKAAVLAEGQENGKLSLPNLRAGAVMTGTQRKSVLIQNSARMILNGVKRAERNLRQFVEPAEGAVGKLTNPETKQLATLLKKEMFDGEKSGETLSPRMQATYESIRKMQEEALQAQNEARLEMGMDPITPRQAYLSSRWSGTFRMPVYSKEGKLIWYIAEKSKRGAENALKYLQKQGIEVDTTKSKVEFRGGGEQTRGGLEDAYLTMLKALDPSDPRIAEVKSIMEEAMANSAYDSLGQSKHFEPKANIRGFIGDRPWLGEKAEAYNLLKQQMAYAKNAFRWAESQKAVTPIKELLADPDIQSLQPSNVEYVRQYVKNHLGYGEHPLIRNIENTLSKALGFDKALAYEGTGIAKSLFLTQKLFANVGYYASQGLQMANTIAEHGSLTSKGYKHNPMVTMTKANVDFAAGLLKDQVDVFTGKDVNISMSEFGKEAWKYMEDNGISKQNLLDEASGLGQYKSAEAIKRVVDFPIAFSEKVIRTNSFLAFAHHLEQSGKFPKNVEGRTKLFQMAEDATNNSMVNFTREERAMGFSKIGLVGRAAETLKSYLVNYYNNLARYSQDALNGSPRALAYYLAAQGLIYGALNLPGMQEAHDGWELLKKVFPDKVYKLVKDVDIKKTLIDNMGDWAYGGASKLTGANLSSRGNVALDSQFALDGMFPFLSDAYKQSMSAASALVNPNETTLNQAMYNSAPSGPIQANVALSKPFQAGQTPDGKTIYQKPTKLGEHEYDIARTPSQTSYRKMGLTALDEAKQKDLQFAQYSQEKEMSNRRKDNITKMFDALVRKDDEDFKKSKDNYIAFHGDPDTMVNDLITEAFKMKVSKDRLAAISRADIPTLMKLKALKEVLGGIK